MIARHLHALSLHPRASVSAAALVVALALAVAALLEVASTGWTAVVAALVGVAAGVVPFGAHERRDRA